MFVDTIGLASHLSNLFLPVSAICSQYLVPCYHFSHCSYQWYYNCFELLTVWQYQWLISVLTFTDAPNHLFVNDWSQLLVWCWRR